MRVLLWTDYFWPAIGGAEVFALNLLRGLQGRGIEFEVVANSTETAPADAALPDGLAVHRLPIRTALSRHDPLAAAALRRTIVELLARLQPDLVHEISLGPSDVFVHDARLRTRVPCLVTLQQHIPRHLLSADATIGRALRAVEWIVACSHAVRAELLEAIPEVAGRCSVIHNALPDADHRPVLPPPRSPRLLCLGRLVEQKGFDVALQAFAAARAAVPGVRLVIAGDGPERGPLEARARQLGVAEEVDFLGWVHPQQTGALIDSATAVLMPSRREPMALVGLETALRARPLIATRVGGTIELVADGESGLLLAVDDAPALSRAVVRLLRDPAAAAAMGGAARARALRLFPWHAHLAAYLALYERVGRRSRPPSV
jgi:glycogen synthase